MNRRTALGWANGGGYACPAAPSRADQIALFNRAQELGVRFHDTAIDYGRGYAEEGLGMAWTLADIPRSQLWIQSKVLRKIVPQGAGAMYREAGLWNCPEPYASRITAWDWSREGILEQARESRERLRIDYHDGLSLHDPAEAMREAGLTPVDIGAEALAALRDLQEKGLLREIGVGTKEISILPELLKLVPGAFSYFMIMNYNLLDHHDCIEELIPRCQDAGVRLFLAGPYASGILAGPEASSSTFYYRPPRENVRRKLACLWRVAREFGLTDLRAAAVQFVAANRAFAQIVFGGRSPNEIGENIGNLSANLADEFWNRLREAEVDGERLIHPRAPLPIDHS